MSAQPRDDVLTSEQAHLDRSRDCLELMRRAADAITDGGIDAFASESLGAARARRLAALADDGTVPPFFGRIDQAATTETFHLGRRHIRDGTGQPMVIDWRAPMSTGFYRATATDPMGLRRRRRFGFAAGALTSYEDEDLREASATSASQILLEEIERPRVGPMRDIVATIAPDQDELVRAPIERSICIQGAPGTGKTAVGLHRAAYLLYTYPDRLRVAGVLVIGPNRAFLSYISAILPALGEAEVEQVGLAELTATVAVRGVEDDAVALLKGDARMAEVLRRAVYGGIGKPTRSVPVPLAGRRYRIDERSLRRHVDDLRRAGIGYAAARERLRLAVAEEARRLKEAGGGSPTDAEMRQAARSGEVREFADEVWPAISGPGLLAELLGSEDRLARSARGILTDTETALLHRAAPTRWTAADTVLLDEIDGLLHRVNSYGHIIVDEAQDLSPMQCRAVARRCATGSITVLGDLAQATTPWSSTSWAQSLRDLGKPDAQVEPLTLGYRVPAEVLDFASRLLPHLGVDVPPGRSLRHSAGALRVQSVLSMDTALAEAAATLLQQVGSVGVICADADVARAVGALLSAGLQPEVVSDAAAGARLSVVSATMAQGLEFDSVIVVEPAQIVAAESRGLHRLYVVLTRAVSRLVVLHAAAMPRELSTP